MNKFDFGYDKTLGRYIPAAYPDKRSDEWDIPEDIRSDHSRLNSIIETKYSREYLKICAFYNKLFPNLKTASWNQATYNVSSFTALDQERGDTGTGISSNYLKQIVDQVVSRLGTVGFEPALLADIPTLEYVIYKDEVERLLRKVTRDWFLTKMTTEVFHDAAILGYSHVFIDPVTHKLVKANDFEVGFFEAQFNHSDIKQMLYRNYAFPVASLLPYMAKEDEATQAKMIEATGNKTTIDFKMYFDCLDHLVYVTIGNTTLTPINYPFDTVQMVTFCWDLGFSKVTSTSLFDLLYPVQRELNKIMAKMQQLIRMYKGAVPIINGADDLEWKGISNGAGEALYINSPRSATEVITIINPTPLDPALSAEVVNRKTEMYELAGIQQMSFDMENMRSAAAVIALDQTRDTVFQAQLEGISAFVKQVFNMLVTYNSQTMPEGSVDWKSIRKLLDSAVIDLKPVHVNDPLGNKGGDPGNAQPDYSQIQIARIVTKIIKGEQRYEDVPFTVNKPVLKAIMAATMVKLDALNIEIPEHVIMFMVEAYIEDVQYGQVALGLV